MPLIEKEYYALTVGARPKQGSAFFSEKNATEENPLAYKTADLIIDSSVRLKASDIHVESQEGFLRVRYRIDGILHDGVNIPAKESTAIIARLRIMAGLDPEVGMGRYKPQDGRIQRAIGNTQFDFRMSTFPGLQGEKIVIRVLGRDTGIQSLSDLGFFKQTLMRVDMAIRNPNGIMTITGPAGHGKSTTLYAILQTLNTSGVNIMTLEDPVESVIRGITQASVKQNAGFDFISGLRAILRQDPNIIMVGEIRDRETAEIAIRASLTGHFVLTTLHTNNAVSTITRFMDMGIEPYLVSSALVGTGAQRLVRRICEKCRATQPISEEQKKMLNYYMKGDANLLAFASQLKEVSSGKGCEACNFTGYNGRIVLFEFCVNTPKLRELISAKAPREELQRQARADGMEPLIIDGLRKVAARATSLSEVFRVLDLI